MTAVLVTFVFIASLATQAQDIPFGNSPASTQGGFQIFSLSPNNQSIGWAVSFTPTMNFNFSGVTLWLSGYTQPFGLQLWAGPDPNYPIGYMDFGAALTNDGSFAAFTFSGGQTLDAGQTYWLVAYSGETETSVEPIFWTAGTEPTGDAVFNGTYSEFEGSVNTENGMTTSPPTFTFDAVPEPSLMTFAILFLASFLAQRRLIRGSGHWR